MMTQEENRLLTEIGHGTPCGEFMRRYWQPAALSEELPAGGAPLPVKLLGEELVLFRDDRGRPGLLALHCSHRGADLSYGRVEDGGLRCIYHGWLYDISGRCLDQPGEPGGGERRNSIRHPAYPCQERAGVVFAYLGPGDPPLLPDYEFLAAPAGHTSAIKIFQECNYLQGNEGNADPIHTSFLHRNLRELEDDKDKVVRGSDRTYNTLQAVGQAPTIDVEVTDFGFRIYTVRRAGADKSYLKVTNFIYPNLAVVNGDTGRAGGGYLVNWHVPIDDTHHWKYVFIFSRSEPLPAAQEEIFKNRSDLTPDYRLKPNPANRYLQDRESMKTKSFSGLGPNFQVHDSCATVGAGPIQDRTREHLVSSDKGIVAMRKLLLKAVQDVQEGREAPHVVRRPELNRFPHLVVLSEVASSSTDWRAHIREAGSEDPSSKLNTNEY